MKMTERTVLVTKYRMSVVAGSFARRACAMRLTCRTVLHQDNAQNDRCIAGRFAPFRSDTEEASDVRSRSP